jgi:hypothetical protein
MALTCKKSLMTLNIGDYVWCKYTATNGAVGTFSDIATKEDIDVSNNVIPVTNSLAPNGYFKFIVSGFTVEDKVILIADRNIQHNISWDVLNTNGICSGISLKYTGNIIPKMTSNTTLYGIASATSEYGGAWNAYAAFDDNTASYWGTQTGVTSAKISYQFTSAKKIVMYTISPADAQHAPKNWTYEGSNNGIDWDILDIRTNEIEWTSSRVYKIQNDMSYSYYRINIASTNGSDIGIQELTMHELFVDDSHVTTMRLLTGGMSSTDFDNEWDKIIIGSTLGGNITSGDNTVWNLSNSYSWMSTSLTSNNTSRIKRGLGEYNNALASSISTGVGFRPVLIVEQLNTLKFLILDNNQFKTLLNGNLITVANLYDDEITKENAFLNNGMDNLNLINNSIINQTITNPINIVLYKK